MQDGKPDGVHIRREGATAIKALWGLKQRTFGFLKPERVQGHPHHIYDGPSNCLCRPAGGALKMVAMVKSHKWRMAIHIRLRVVHQRRAAKVRKFGHTILMPHSTEAQRNDSCVSDMTPKNSGSAQRGKRTTHVR